MGLLVKNEIYYTDSLFFNKDFIYLSMRNRERERERDREPETQAKGEAGSLQGA